MKVIPLLSAARCGTMCFMWHLKSISNNPESTLFYDRSVQDFEGTCGNNNILLASELLKNDWYYNKIRRDSNFDESIFSDITERPDKSIEKFYEALNLLPISPEYFTWSFHAGHIGLEHPHFEDIFSHLDSAIILERRNRLATWISQKKAHHFKKFANYDYTDYKIEFSVEGESPLENYETFAEIKDIVFRTYRRLLKKYNIPYVDIFYEDWEHLNPTEQLNHIVDKINQLPGVNLKVDNDVKSMHNIKQNNYKKIEENFINPEVYLEYVKNNS
jgi:hypothetical protein|tara:strand:+ start:259 stop:1080 length:822 start_codon:yes stop_codon:yes gene_type:complete